MKITSLRDLFEIEMWYAYDCEQKLVKKGIPSMIEACSSPELRNALERHLEETRIQVTRLEQVFSTTGTKMDTKSNAILDKMFSAVSDSVSHTDAGPLRDAALIINGNQVEHYEIALYGSLVSFANHLGFREAASLLQQTLDEEKAADAKLTEIAETWINQNAGQGRRAATGM